MIFNSVDFIVFLPITLLVYYLLPKKIRIFWLLLASYYFYVSYSVKYSLLMFIITVFSYFYGLYIDHLNKSNDVSKQKKTKISFYIAITVILLILFIFKYLNFATEIISSITKFNFETNIILPIGLSFYIFQVLGYIIDIFKGKIDIERNFIKYCLYVSFFPKLLQGPIERTNGFLKQIDNPKKLNWDDFRESILVILWGYFLKMVIADRLAIIVDTVYGNIEQFYGMYLIGATLLFSIQIYSDFYGYSCIALGVAKLFGFDLINNFKSPYISTSIAEFWRNWHISLTSWFRDYIYIPLGGNRKGRLRKYFNILIVFLVSGLWHGSSYSFIVWGLINGLYQVIGDILKPIKNKILNILMIKQDSLTHKTIQILISFVLISFAWIFFRANSLTEAIDIICSMTRLDNYKVILNLSFFHNCGISNKSIILIIISLFVLLFTDVCNKNNIYIRKIILKQDYWFRWLFIATVITIIFTFGIWGTGYNQASFIYFKF